MTDQPWRGDVVGLVEAFRRGERHPREEVEATLAAAEADPLNAICHVVEEAALEEADRADLSLPFGGVPLAVKELLAVDGWPDTEGSVPLADRRFAGDSISVRRLRAAGAIPTVQTTSSEFGGVNQTFTKLHGATGNPWNPLNTPGGSSGGSAAGVAGGLFSLATASDGGGSIRIPAGFCGLVGLKPTYGRIPRGPGAIVGNSTSVEGTVSRSIRDTARFLDVTNGFDSRDPKSLPRVEGHEVGLGSHIEDLPGLRAAIIPNLGTAVLAPETEELVRAAAEELLAATRMQRVEIDLRLPSIMGAWSLLGVIGTRKELGELWPGCAPDLTGMMRLGIELGEQHLDLDAMVTAETRRVELHEAMADIFDQVDVVIAATNPSTAFEAAGRLPSVFGGREATTGNNGALTAPSNIYGNPAISLPAATASDGLPIGVQVLAPHHREPLLLDIGMVWEKCRPWPLTAPPLQSS